MGSHQAKIKRASVRILRKMLENACGSHLWNVKKIYKSFEMDRSTVRRIISKLLQPELTRDVPQLTDRSPSTGRLQKPGNRSAAPSPGLSVGIPTAGMIVSPE